VESVSKAALVGTPATLTCKVTGLSSNVEIAWLPSSSGIYTSEPLDANSGTQTSKLLIKNPESDKTYTCEVKSKLYPDSPLSRTDQHLDTFSK
jgi:hypothetical protein